MKIGDFGKLENCVSSGWSMSATRRVKTHPASLECLKSFGNGRCISNKISIADAKNMRPSEKMRAKWMLWRSLTPFQALCMLIFTRLKRFNDHPERARFDTTRKSPKTEPRYAPRSAHPGALSWVPLSARLSLRKLDFAQPGSSFFIGYGVDRSQVVPGGATRFDQPGLALLDAPGDTQLPQRAIDQ